MTLVDTHSPDVGQRLVLRLWVFVWIGLGLLIPGLLIQNTTVSLGFTISSTTFFAVALVVMGINRRYLASSAHFHASLDVFVHNDAAPTFFVSDDGEITYLNHAAIARFGDALHKSLVMVLSDYSANPVNVIFRLQNKARKARAASEDIVTDQGHMRLSTHFIGPKGFIWRLEDLVEHQSDGTAALETMMPMLLANSAGKVLELNRAFRNLTGRKVDHLDQLFQSLPVHNGTYQEIATKSGLTSMRLQLLTRPNGQVEYYFEVGASQTPSLFDELPVAMLQLSPLGEVQSANRLARQLLGDVLKPKARLGDLVRGLGRSVGDWLDDAVAGRVLNKPEVVQVNDNKQDRFLQITLARSEGQTNGDLIAVLNDATELKTLEAQFVQSQKMQAIGQLAGGVAHDFNNLLTAISGYCDLLLLRHDEGDPDYGDLMQITQNANRAASLVNQLLAFSRKQNLQPETLDLPDIVSELTHLLNRLLGEKVTLTVKTGHDLPQIRADKRQLEQVLMNLVVNARDAMTEGGEVVLETGRLELAQDFERDRALVVAGTYLSIKVTDRGTGIAENRLSKIFEPFYTTKKTGEGTGLGLSMVYGIIKQSGGFIFVDSVIGQGTSFEIMLPAFERVETSKVEAIAPPAEKLAAPAKEGGVILLVEDEAPVRAFAARALKMRGYTVL
ncbi:MAG: PAS domain-containing protein, partial [Alphaproteobacteria bacterium]|nr:PAS domain-containing protein [Alphaproteobacteria bacterium]